RGARGVRGTDMTPTTIEAAPPAAPVKLMTTEEFLALPDDGVERWLINGVLRERRPPMTTRNRFHGRLMTRVSKFLDNWLDEQPPPRGWVTSGDTGVRLRRDPDCVVGIDVLYVS